VRQHSREQLRTEGRALRDSCPRTCPFAETNNSPILFYLLLIAAPALSVVISSFVKTCTPPYEPEIKKKKTRWYLPLLLVTLAAPVLSARAQNAAETPAEADAASILKKMSEYLAQASRFSVVVRAGYDVVQESGQKIEFGEIRKITVNRPNDIRIEVERSNGQKGLVIYDGKEIIIYMANENVYATDPKPGTIDEAIKYAVSDLKVQVPLAMMLLSTLPSELDNRIDSVDVSDFAG
jgi:outer membrane lipoprotein-sorting protein